MKIRAPASAIACRPRGRHPLCIRRLISGRVHRSLWTLSLPLIVNNVLFTFMGFADLFMVGQLGEDVISGLGNANQVSTFLILLFSSLGQGGSILAAQYWGARDAEGLKKNAGTFVSSGFAVGILLCAVTFLWGRQLVWLLTLGKGEAVAGVGGNYLRILSFGYLLSVPGSMAASVLFAMGDTKSPVAVSLSAGVIDLAGNALLIFGLGPFPRMGYRGAALSTSIAQALQGMAMLALLVSRKGEIRFSLRGLFRVDREQLAMMLKLGLPMTVDGIWWQGARIIYSLIFNWMGSSAYAAYAIVKSVKAMVTVPTSGLQTATMIATGQELGRKNLFRAKVSAHEGVKLSVAVMALPAILVFLLAVPIVGMFKIEIDTFKAAVSCTMILAFSIFFTTVNSVIPGVLRAGGDTLAVMRTSLLCFLLVGGPLAFIFGIVFRWGVVGAFVGISLEEVAKAAVLALRMRRGRWVRSLV